MAAMIVCGSENIGGNVASRLLGRNTAENGTEAVGTEFLQLGVCGFEDAVRGEKNRVAGHEIDGDFVVLGVRKQAERNARDANRLDNAVADEEGVWPASIGERELACAGIVDGEKRSDESAIEPRGVQAGVEHGQHFGGQTRMLDDVLANNANRERRKERSGDAFPGDVSESYAEAAFSVGKKVVEIAGELARRDVGGSKFEAGHFTRASGKELALDFAGGIEIALQAALVFSSLFVEARVFESDRDVGTQGGKHAFVFGGKGMRYGALKIENADEALLEEQGNDKLRTRLGA